MSIVRPGQGGRVGCEGRRRAIAHKNQTNKWQTQKGMDFFVGSAGRGKGQRELPFAVAACVKFKF